MGAADLVLQTLRLPRPRRSRASLARENMSYDLRPCAISQRRSEWPQSICATRQYGPVEDLRFRCRAHQLGERGHGYLRGFDVRAGRCWCRRLRMILGASERSCGASTLSAATGSRRRDDGGYFSAGDDRHGRRVDDEMEALTSTADQLGRAVAVQQAPPRDAKRPSAVARAVSTPIRGTPRVSRRWSVPELFANDADDRGDLHELHAGTSRVRWCGN